MDGSGINFVIIPLIVVPCLAGWLIGMYYAAAHPTWKGRPEMTAAPARAVVPGQRTAEVERPARQETTLPAQASAVPAGTVPSRPPR